MGGISCVVFVHGNQPDFREKSLDVLAPHDVVGKCLHPEVAQDKGRRHRELFAELRLEPGVGPMVGEHRGLPRAHGDVNLRDLRRLQVTAGQHLDRCVK